MCTYVHTYIHWHIYADKNIYMQRRWLILWLREVSTRHIYVYIHTQICTLTYLYWHKYIHAAAVVDPVTPKSVTIPLSDEDAMSYEAAKNALFQYVQHPLRLQRTATHCNALQRTATHCNVLRYTAMHCNRSCVVLWSCHGNRLSVRATPTATSSHCNALQDTASHCNRLKHAATHCHALQHNFAQMTSWWPMHLQHTATHNNTLQHTATHYNTLQHCNTLQHADLCSCQEFLVPVCVYVRVFVSVYVCVCVCVYVSVCVCTRIHIFLSTPLSLSLSIHTYIYTYIYVYIYMCVCIYMYI